MKKQLEMLNKDYAEVVLENKNYSHTIEIYMNENESYKQENDYIKKQHKDTLNIKNTLIKNIRSVSKDKNKMDLEMNNVILDFES